MSDIFSQLLCFAKEFGVTQDAHMYSFQYASVTVKSEDGRVIVFTADVKGEDDNDTI